MSISKSRDRFYRLHEIINLIDNHQFEKAITALNGAILPVDDIADKEEQRLVARSNSFINGAIKNLKTLPPPPKNALNEIFYKTPEYYERQKKIKTASDCVRTVIQGPRNSTMKEIENKINAILHEVYEMSLLLNESQVETKKGEGLEVEVDATVISQLKARKNHTNYPETVFKCLEGIYQQGSSQRKAVESLFKSCGFDPSKKKIDALLRAWRSWRKNKGQRKQKKIVKI